MVELPVGHLMSSRCVHCFASRIVAADQDEPHQMPDCSGTKFAKHLQTAEQTRKKEPDGSEREEQETKKAGKTLRKWSDMLEQRNQKTGRPGGAKSNKDGDEFGDTFEVEKNDPKGACGFYN